MNLTGRIALENTMLIFYREKNGDYVVADHASFWYRGGHKFIEGRATAIWGTLLSVQTTSVSKGYLKYGCRRVAKAAVPKEWLQVLIGE